MKPWLVTLTIQRELCTISVISLYVYSLHIVTRDLPLGGWASGLPVRLQYKDPILALLALVHFVVEPGMGTGLVWTEAAVHSFLDSLERWFIVAVRTEKVGLERKRE